MRVATARAAGRGRCESLGGRGAGDGGRGRAGELSRAARGVKAEGLRREGRGTGQVHDRQAAGAQPAVGEVQRERVKVGQPERVTPGVVASGERCCSSDKLRKPGG